ncbi:heterokaryon incompatibility protein-domain-containing protein [Chaetomidium leptoderma]|uniref:Heterokaryon incompatibility protein-domain-containing protein n=1 Tax=Chaetomidium leptoderma TaxID=669021 RepID=A0AAN6VD11_9PEZI|nr:heterokaryon incompatibility protein-domain-containing protein [Chaetomidium leptoderma]
MAGPYLVPAPIAIPLMILVIAFIPLTPIAWAWIIFTSIARGVRQEQHPKHVTKSIGRWIGLSIVLPWAAVIVLWLMVVAQLILAPLVLFHQLRNLGETVTWISAQLSPALHPPDHPNPIQDTPTANISSLPRYKFPRLPSTSPTPIRLLSLHPGPFSSPIRGTITTTTLTSPPRYDALSYTWSTYDSNNNNNNNNNNSPEPPPPPTKNATLLILTPPNHQPTTPPQWQTLPITANCAAALRRLRLETKPRMVWVDQVCINQDYEGDHDDGDDGGEDGREKGRQVAVMDQIFCGARRVVVYTGENGGAGTDGLFDWVNGLGEEEVRGSVVVSGGEGRGGGLLGRWVRKVLDGKVDEVAGELERVWRVGRSTVRQVWKAVEGQYGVSGLALAAPAVPVAPPENLEDVLRAYFARPWFRRVWPLQEVLLPELARVRFLCGGKTTTGERMVHLSTLLRRDAASKELDLGRMFRLFRQRQPKGRPKGPHLLDILIETRNRQCEDPRDRIFGVLGMTRQLDGGDPVPSDPCTKVDYRVSVAEVYASHSARLIRLHGPGFFLALIKSQPKVKGLPSWAADWTVPWPNMQALPGVESVARSRVANDKDGVLGFETDKRGRLIMMVTRPRIVRGFFTRDGHIDGAKGTHIENVRQLRRDEILVEMYPRLALLLRGEKGEPEHYAFVRACPHALSREGIEKAVADWGRVVVHQEDVGRQENDGSPPKAYLSLPGVYKIV